MTTSQSKKNSFIYLDNAASTPIDRQVIDEMLPFMQNNYGNPSSLHKLGRYSRQGILDSRLRIAKMIGSSVNEIFFTSGGTESNNLAIVGTAKLISKTNPFSSQVLVSEIEHDSILETAKTIERELKFEVISVPVNKDGIVNEERFKEMVSAKTGLVSVMLVNNEIGTIQPIKKLADTAKNKNSNTIFHTDAVQALGKIPISVKDLNVDLMSMSSHKINGPKGAGALYIKTGLNPEPILFGGGQERKLRSGTENVQSIVGFGKACEISNQKLLANQSEKLREVQRYAIDKIIKEIPFSRLNGSKKERIPHNINLSFLGVNGEDLLIKLDENEIASSTGSACSANKKQKASHVLKALGLSHQEVTGSIRLSMGYQNTKEEMETTITRLKEIVKELRILGEFEFDAKKKVRIRE
jgi:cysteine desulfurase